MISEFNHHHLFWNLKARWIRMIYLKLLHGINCVLEPKGTICFIFVKFKVSMLMWCFVKCIHYVQQIERCKCKQWLQDAFIASCFVVKGCLIVQCTIIYKPQGICWGSKLWTPRYSLNLKTLNAHCSISIV